MKSLLRALAVLGIFAAACAPATQPTPTTSQTGGQAPPAGPKRAANQVLRIGTNRFPAGVTNFASAFNGQWYGAMFDSLVQFDKDFNLKPAIATKWELLPDNSAWRFTLRNDLVFSNGDKLTAEDVAFTVNEQTTGRSPQWALSPFLTGAKAVNETTVDLLITQRDVATLFNSVGWLIWPAKYYQSVGKDAFLLKPIGTGPYVLAEFRPNTEIIYRKRTDREHPYRKVELSEIVVRAVPEPSALLAGLRTGEIDFANGSTFLADQAIQARNQGMTVDIKQVSYISILFSEEKVKGTPLENEKVRQAMNYAVDKVSMAKNIFAGMAEPIGQYAVPEAGHYNPTIQPVPYDVATAKRLLTEAGYPNGFKLENGLVFTNSPLNAQIFQAVQGFHREIGIQYELDPVELGAYIDFAYGRGNRTRPPMFEAGSSNTNGVFSFTWGFLKCQGGAGWWCVPALDTAMEKALAETDTAKRKQYLQEAVKGLRDSWNMIYLTSTPQFNIYSKKMAGFNWTTPSYYSLDSVYMVE
ncbi:MAG: ABC transporter substrate-binding protein [Dehalococcoidia bacterium]